jgi:hypothetical protein
VTPTLRLLSLALGAEIHVRRDLTSVVYRRWLRQKGENFSILEPRPRPFRDRSTAQFECRRERITQRRSFPAIRRVA